MLACRADWFRLPKVQRDEITSTYRRNASRHLMAVRDAIRWYQDNPREG